MHNVYVNIKIIKSTEDLSGDYLSDKEYKHRMTMMARDLWSEKDSIIDRWHQEITHEQQ